MQLGWRTKHANKIKEETQKASRKLDEKKKVRNIKTNELRAINDEYAILVSSINKNMESLSLYYDYKLFLDSLAPKDVQEE